MTNEKKVETVYCIKYALTRGVLLVSGYESRSPDRFMRNEDGFFQSLSKNEWSRDGAEALLLAAAMRDKKIKSIEKQRDKLLQMGFELPDKPVNALGEHHPAFNATGTMTGRLSG